MHRVTDYQASEILVRIFIAVKRHHDQGNSYKEKHLTGAGLLFRDFILCHYGGKHGSIQVDMVLEKELRVLHLDLQEV